MSDVLLEAAAEQLLQQLPSAPWNDGPDDSSSGSDRTWMLAVSEKNEAAAAAVARALAQCINVFGPDQRAMYITRRLVGRDCVSVQGIQPNEVHLVAMPAWHAEVGALLRMSF
eukprot:1162121-Pelagomonas_calceolata.AAC.6